MLYAFHTPVGLCGAAVVHLLEPSIAPLSWMCFCPLLFVRHCSRTPFILHPPVFSMHGFVGRARRSTGTSCGVPAALAAADEDWSVEGCDEGMGDGQAPWHMAVAGPRVPCVVWADGEYSLCPCAGCGRSVCASVWEGERGASEGGRCGGDAACGLWEGTL